MNLAKLYNFRCHQPSAINEHLPILKKYAEQCDVVTEFGVQGGISTTAFLMADPEMLYSYDIKFDLRLLELIISFVEEYNISDHALGFTMSRDNRRTIWTYFLANSLRSEIVPTDLLFIDTLHTYLQLKEELHLHHSKVKKWIILHDTKSFGMFAEGHQDIENPSAEQVAGLYSAINEFLDIHSEWFIKESYDNNNGLTVLERS